MADTARSEGWETLKTKHSEVRRVPLDSIYVDTRFQRGLNEHKKDQIKSEYHPEGIGVMAVAAIQGGDPTGSDKPYASIDGQTRLIALRQFLNEVAAGDREYDGELPSEVLAEVYDGKNALTVAEAAELFRLRNNQVAVPVQERNRIGLTAGDPVLKEVQRQVEMAGFRLFADNGDAATFGHVDTGMMILRWAYKYHRPDLLAEALTVQANAFGVQLGAVDKIVLRASANLMRKNPQLDEEQFSELLRDRGNGRITAEADGLKNQNAVRPMRMATAVEFYLAAEYNKLRGVQQIQT